MKPTLVALGVLLSIALLGGARLGARTTVSAGKSSPGERKTFLIVGGDSTSVFHLSEGIPQQVSGIDIGVGGVLGIDRFTQNLYTTDISIGDQMSGFHYSGQGGFSVTPLPGSPYSRKGLFDPTAAVVDAKDRLLYITDWAVGTISAFQFNKEGVPVQVAGSPFPADSEEPAEMVLDEANDFLYVANFDCCYSTISGYQINASTGALTELPGSPYATTTATAVLALDAAHNLLYAASEEGTLWAYSIQSTGALAPAPGSPINAGGVLLGISVSPNGTLVYATSQLANLVLGYEVDTQTGELTAVPGSPFRTGSTPGNLIFDPTGHFLYISNYDSYNFSGYSVSSSGALTPLPGSPFAAVNSAFGLAIVTLE
jgi:DNA-binding beta-propeller fold protein YncE